MSPTKNVGQLTSDQALRVEAGQEVSSTILVSHSDHYMLYDVVTSPHVTPFYWIFQGECSATVVSSNKFNVEATLIYPPKAVLDPTDTSSSYFPVSDSEECHA